LNEVKGRQRRLLNVIFFEEKIILHKVIPAKNLLTLRLNYSTETRTISYSFITISDGDTGCEKILTFAIFSVFVLAIIPTK